MGRRIDPAIDKALIEACRALITKHKKASESLVMADATLEELVTLVRPVCSWSRDRIRTRVITLRKKPPSVDRKMPGLQDLFPEEGN